MSEEGGSFIGQLKNQIIAGVGVALTTAGTVFLDEIKAQLGLSEPVEEVVTEPAAQQPEIIINIPEQKKDTVVKYVAPKKEKTATEKRKDEFDW